MKKTSTLLIATLGLLLGSVARAQIDVPVSTVSLEFPGVTSVTLTIGGSSETVLPTPFLIAGMESHSRSWLCMDPLQRIYTNQSGLGATVIHYASTNPTDFDLWNPSSPGLTVARVQNLADLFQAHSPLLADDALTSGALQLAVWEIANEFSGNPFDLTTGAFTASNNSAMITLAQSFLDSLNTVGVQGRGNVAGLSFLIDGTLNPGGTLVQDLVGWDPTTVAITPVPEPSTYGIAAALGLAGVAALRRRRSRA